MMLLESVSLCRPSFQQSRRRVQFDSLGVGSKVAVAVGPRDLRSEASIYSACFEPALGTRLRTAFLVAAS